MSDVTIDESGLLDNENGPKDNPRETEDYSHALEHTVPGDCTVVAFSLTGDVPVGIEIGSTSGVISGRIDGMFNQKSCSPKREDVYLEIDNRNYPNKNGRFEGNEFDFSFTVKCDYLAPMDSSPFTPSTIPRDTSASVSIKLIKNHSADAILMAQELLDGDSGPGGRLPYHCQFSGPSSQSECEAIGGIWNGDTNVCSIAQPQTQVKCEELGGIWEEKETGANNYYCNLVLIKTQTECELIGGKWTKNILKHEGIEYDNSEDWLKAKGIKPIPGI